jgi:hypothetical protein
VPEGKGERFQVSRKEVVTGNGSWMRIYKVDNDSSERNRKDIGEGRLQKGIGSG